jgi:tetratricopeptide (TPR) repeat protein
MFTHRPTGAIMNRRPAILLVLSFLFALQILSARPDASTLVADGWKAWEKGDHEAVEGKFLEALKEDPNNSRAQLGLALLYSLQGKDEKSASAFRAALNGQSDIYPYLYSQWVTSRVRAGLGTSETRELLEGLTGKADSLGILRAMANEVLGAYYEEKGDIERSKDYYGKINAVTDWTVIGPFDNVSASGYDKTYPPEGEYNTSATYPGRNGVPAKWFRIAAVRNDDWIDFKRYFAQQTAVFYANTFIYSPKEQTADLRVGTSGSFRLFLNDAVVHESSDEFDNDLDTYIARTTLHEGWNRVMIKCGCSEINRCNFLLRVTDARGEILPGLNISSEPHTYSSSRDTRAERVDNFAVEYFRKKIASNPDHLENYILLADCYLRNDDATNAELTLRDAIRLAPNCALLYDHILEAYSRGDKHDEISRTLDKIYMIDRNVPSALEYKFNEYLEAEKFDKAEEVLAQLERLLPESTKIYELKIDLFSKKNLGEKVIETNHKAFTLFPGNSRFALTEAAIIARTTKKPQEPISIMEDYIARSYDPSVMQALAGTYLGIPDLKKWRAMYDRLLELDPASPGYYYQMANTYSTIEDYASAEQMLRKAIEICPNSSGIWSKLGEVQRIAKKESDAIASYREALKFNPTDYDARAALRELQGKKSVFEQFNEIDVDSLIKHAATAKDYPDEKALILLDDAERVVYEQGASESSQELVVRVFNDLGIDDWKEYYIGFNSYNEELTIEKAEVIKKDGSDVKADIDDNHIVFKSLEPEDIIHLKWHLKNHYSGKLSSQFWDSYYFDGFYPTQHIRYSLIVPENFQFKYGAQNMKAEPVKTKVENGVLYNWSLDDVPAVAYEYGMPTLDDVGRMLYISSISGWDYLVEWYSDVAKTKTRSSYEIKEQVADLLKGKEKVSDEEKMRAIYEFITENIRYSSVAFRQGAYIPQKARDVLVNKIGDCKDVATLCIAMLSEAGLKAHYVLVNTRDEGSNRNIRPSIAFNHCIVAVETSNGLKFLDLTANNFPIGAMPNADVDAFALLIKPGTKEPLYLPKANTIPCNASVQTSIELRDDNSMAGERRTSLTGSLSASIRNSLRHEAKKEQEKKMLAGLTSDFPDVKLVNFETENLDNLEPEVKYLYKYEVPRYITDAGDFKFMKIPWVHSAESDEALSYDRRNYPYDYWPSADTLTENIEIKVPQGYQPVDLPKGVSLKSPVAEYSLKYSFSGEKLIAQRRYINKKLVVSTDEYPEFKGFYNSVVKEDTRQILLKRKGKK